jgi:uncharacterized membrane protein
MRLIFILFFCYLTSCENAAKPPLLTEDSARPDGTELNDTVPIILQDTSQANKAKAITPPPATQLPQGFYRAKLPCQGCPGLEHTVFFKANKTYVIEEASGDKAGDITKTTGTFNPASGTIWAYKGQVVKARYSWSGDTLNYHLPNGKRIAMQKLPAAIDNDAWRKKGKEGIRFFGVGNEPFWNLEINQQQGLAFHLAEWSKPLQLPGARATTANDSMVYTASSDTASIKAVIYNRFCSDGMSDFIYTHSIRVDYNGKTFNGCGIMY